MSGAENSGGIHGIRGSSLVDLLGGISLGQSLGSDCSSKSVDLRETTFQGVSLNFRTCEWLCCFSFPDSLLSSQLYAQAFPANANNSRSH